MTLAALSTAVVLIALWLVLFVQPVSRLADPMLGFGLLPLVTLLVLRQDPRRYGWRWGPRRWWLGFVLPALAATLAVLLALEGAGLFPDYFAYYRLPPEASLGRRALLSAVDLFPWEFLFRGFYLWMLVPFFGRWAIVVQMVPFALSHWGRPPLELWTSFPGGLIVGWLAYRSRSFLPGFVLHLGLDLLTVLVAAPGQY